MAHATSSQLVFDCGTCAKPVHYNANVSAWMHADRHATCLELSIVTVELTKVSPRIELDSLALVA